jgi:hypothetical protein
MCGGEANTVDQQVDTTTGDRRQRHRIIAVRRRELHSGGSEFGSHAGLLTTGDANSPSRPQKAASNHATHCARPAEGSGEGIVYRCYPALVPSRRPNIGTLLGADSPIEFFY